MTGLTGKCIWITGATSGIGKALAGRLCEAGNFVIASGRNKDALNALILAAKGRMCALPFDVTADPQSIHAYRAHLHELTDYLDMVICCAGVCEYEDDLLFDPRMYRRVFDVNVIGTINTLHLAIPLLKRSSGQARIALLGSLSSVVAFPRAEAYGASKAAVQYLAESLSVDLKNTHLAVSLVRPGFVQTRMTETNDFPMPFMVSANTAADTIIRGLERGRAVIDFPRRLSWPLRSLHIVKWLWLRLIAPRLSRRSSGRPR